MRSGSCSDCLDYGREHSKKVPDGSTIFILKEVLAAIAWVTVVNNPESSRWFNTRGPFLPRLGRASSGVHTPPRTVLKIALMYCKSLGIRAFCWLLGSVAIATDDQSSLGRSFKQQILHICIFVQI